MVSGQWPTTSGTLSSETRRRSKRPSFFFSDRIVRSERSRRRNRPPAGQADPLHGAGNLLGGEQSGHIIDRTVPSWPTDEPMAMYPAVKQLSLDVATIAAMRAHRARQAKERLAAGASYIDSGLVFTMPDGTPAPDGRYTVVVLARTKKKEVTRATELVVDRAFADDISDVDWSSVELYRLGGGRWCRWSRTCTAPTTTSTSRTRT